MADHHADHDTDFVAWTEEQAALLRSGAMGDLDLEHLAEEIASMGGQIRRELRSRLVQLLLHLLKWQYQPGRRTPSWRYSIADQRDEIGDLLQDNPSLKPTLGTLIDDAYPRARVRAADQTGLPLKAFPATLPFSPAEILNPRFPGDLGGAQQESETDDLDQ